MQTAIGKIREEHRAISAVLDALQKLARGAEGPRAEPPFPALRAMIRYIDEFPEKQHHPKEETHLFARLAARAPHAAQLIDALRDEHDEGARLVRELERALVLFEDAGPSRAAAFRAAVDAYAHFHWRHMKKEEQELLPLAERYLTAEDWRAIGDAFAENPDFDRMFARLVGLAPAPVGLGEEGPQKSPPRKRGPSFLVP